MTDYEKGRKDALAEVKAEFKQMYEDAMDTADGRSPGTWASSMAIGTAAGIEQCIFEIESREGQGE